MEILEDANIVNHVLLMAKKHPYMRAVVFPHGRDDNGRVSYTQLTYQQLVQEMNIVARGLQSEGIVKGSRVALMAKPSLDFFAVFFALFRVGAVPVMIDPGIGVRNIKKCLAEAEAEFFIGITKAQIARVVLGWQRGLWRRTINMDIKPKFSNTCLKTIRVLGESLQECSFPFTHEDDQAAILFTSGSTGAPKGVIYTHKNFNAQIRLLKKSYGIEPGEIDLSTFPLFAVFASALGMTAIIPDMDFTRPARVDPKKIQEAVQNFGVTNMFGSPALLKRTASDWVREGVFFPTLKRILSAGAPVPHQVLAQLTKVLPKGSFIYTPYGATEALPVCNANSHEILNETAALTDDGKGICVGKPVDEIKVDIIRVDDGPIEFWQESLLVSPEEIGEIVVRGPQVTKAYYNNQRANKLAKILDQRTNETIHRMGDLGYFDPDGRLWFCGRKAHRVVTKDNVLYTVPCEAVFNKHHKVSRSALVGVRIGNYEKPILCIEGDGKLSKADRHRMKDELLTLGRKRNLTKDIDEILFHKSFPVDIRHNAKIFREKLRDWAKEK
ncbi:MAG: fatty acid CoA ligase family protein [Bdellovibrionota bacterium]